MSKLKTYTYHKSHSYEDNGRKCEFTTQLYQVGVYGILNNNPSQQGNYKPSDLVKLEKGLKKLESEGKITNLKFGQEITVAEINGFWEEITKN